MADTPGAATSNVATNLPDGGSTSMDFVDHFLDDTMSILRSLSRDDVDAVARELADVRARGGRLFFCGSGGGAGHASHATCDFRKLAHIEAYCVTDNVSELTARVNDDGWESSYSEWLRGSRIAEGDCLFVFSVGGGSVEPPISLNLVGAMDVARETGARVVGVAGRDGGLLRRVADACVLIPTFDPGLVTPQTEGLQALIWHLLVSHPLVAASQAKWESVVADAQDGART
jgi:D-sedoheptulose 7-phosphate isomerase